jgi:hypothetical protein
MKADKYLDTCTEAECEFILSVLRKKNFMTQPYLLREG